MNLIGEQVVHASFGVGRILIIENGIISIQFAESVGMKKFQHPRAFEQFLRMCNPAAQDFINIELSLLLKQLKAEKIRKEELRLKEEESRQSAIKASHKKTTAVRKTKVASEKPKKTKFSEESKE